jgi:hypothetical protein
MEHAGKEGGHEQMLGQATAVLVSLSTLVALEITCIGLLAVFHKMLTLTSPSHAGLFEIILFVVFHVIILIVFNCTFAAIEFDVWRQTGSVTWQAGWW